MSIKNLFITSLFISFCTKSKSSFNNIPSDLLSNHLAPYLDTIDLIRTRSTSHSMHNLVISKLCADAAISLSTITSTASYDLSLEFYDNDEEYQKDSYVIHIYFSNKSAVFDYTFLLVMDSSTDIQSLFRLITSYDEPDELLVEFDIKHNISLKINKIRRFMQNNCYGDSHLKQIFDDIINNEPKYKQMVNEWRNMKRLINTDHQLNKMWNDMLFMIKKDILKIIRIDLNRGFGVELFYNDLWLLFLNQIFDIFVDNTLDKKMICELKMTIYKFDIVVSALLDTVKIRTNYFNLALRDGVLYNETEELLPEENLRQFDEELMHRANVRKKINVTVIDCVVEMDCLQDAVLNTLSYRYIMDELSDDEIEKTLFGLQMFMHQTLLARYKDELMQFAQHSITGHVNSVNT